MEREEKQKKAIYSRGVAKAQAMATALKTIGKFTITKRAGAEGKIFGRSDTFACMIETSRVFSLDATKATSQLALHNAPSRIKMPRYSARSHVYIWIYSCNRCFLVCHSLRALSQIGSG